MKHPITIELEEYFQIARGRNAISCRHWERLPPRIARNTERALRLLNANGLKATFFVDAWIATMYPEVVAGIARDGHEVGCRFGGDRETSVASAIAAVERAAGGPILGVRIEADPKLDALERARITRNFAYESSVDVADGAHVAGVGILGQTWPRASLLLRQAPERAVPHIAASWSRATRQHTLSFKVWELDDEQPHLAVMSPFAQWLSYRNIAAFPERLKAVFDAADFAPARDVLALTERDVPARFPANLPARSTSSVVPIHVPALTVVVPCFNEEEGLPYLKKALLSLMDDAAGRCELSCILVDDGSTDATWPFMEANFADDPRFRLIRHRENRGVGGAMLTGISAATSEVVAVMDSDCSYDPAKLWDMLPALEPGVALVTASPYHRQGAVDGVPPWRLWLSKGASACYRQIVNNKLATYTSCFRIYRRSAVERVSIRNEGFIGVAELLVRLDMEGWRIVEHPAVLERRLFGHSKLKVLKTTMGHLRLLAELWLLRVTNGRWPQTTQLSRNDLERLP